MADVSHLHQGIYSGDHVKEGVIEILYQITPEDTPGLAMFGRGKATHPKHEWLKRTRGTRTGTSGKHRAVPPGDQFQLQTIGDTATDDFENLAVPSRVFNYCEIFRVLPRVDETTIDTSQYGVRDVMGDQVEFRMIDFMIYIEERLWNGTKNAGPTGQGDTTAWQLGGLASEVSDNSLDIAGDEIVDLNMQNIFNKCWADGGRPQDFFSGPLTKSAMVNDLGSNFTKFIDQNERGVVNTLSFYEGATQTITFHLTRDLEDGAVTTGTTTVENRGMLIDRSQVRLVWLREPFIERLPRMAGDERVRIEGQCTLEFGDEKAHGEITDLLIPAALTA